MQNLPLKRTLNIREDRFCLAVANTGNKYKAFDIAGYEAKTQGSKAACVSRLLKRPEIKERIKEITAELMLVHGVTEDRILANLADIAFNKGNAKADRNRALELLGKSKAMFTDNINQTDTQRQRELDEKEQEECEEIAKIRLREFKKEPLVAKESLRREFKAASAG